MIHEGLNYGIPEKEYRKYLGLNNSMLKYLLDGSPAEFLYRMENPEQPTPQMKFGTMLHEFCLERTEFLRKYYCVPPGIGGAQSKAHKSWLEQLAPDEEPIEPEDLERVRDMEASYKRSAIIRQALKEGMKEVVVSAKLNGVLCKAKIDILVPGVYAADLKTTQHVDPDEFGKSCFNYGYHRQAAFYTRLLEAAGCDIAQFLFLPIMKTPPYDCAVFELDDRSLELGHREVNWALKIYKKCCETGNWPASLRSDKVYKVSLPYWALNKR